MRPIITVLLFTFCLLGLLFGCDYGDNAKEREKSLQRKAEISEIERQISVIDQEIARKIKLSGIIGGKVTRGLIDSETSELKSKREVLLMKLRELYRIEQEYQSKR